MLSASFGFDEIYKEMRTFLIDEGFFDEGDHMHCGLSVEETLQRKEFLFKEGFI